MVRAGIKDKGGLPVTRGGQAAMVGAGRRIAFAPVFAFGLGGAVPLTGWKKALGILVRAQHV